ncbi:MAG: PAS domain-containing protein [Spirochaetaceae bacterium]|nr:PAS domain-containing protein [Spirochaetaceae bacterium]
MHSSSRTLILVDLSDRAEGTALCAALGASGLGGHVLEPGRDPAKALHEELADIVLVDAGTWPALVASLPLQPRSYLVLFLAGPADHLPTYIDAGAFDCFLREGPGWQAELVAYLKALGGLRRRFVRAFSALERRYEDLVHALPDIVYELDEDSRFTFVNNSVRLLGYEPSDLAGKHFSVLLSEEDAKAVDRDQILDFFRGSQTGPALAPKLFNERRGLDRRTEGLEVKLRRNPDATGRGGDLLGSVISYGEITAAGEYATQAGGGFVGSVGVIRDITLRRKSEEMLRKLFQAVDQLAVGVLVADRNFLVEYVNPAFLRLSGKGPEEVLGLDLFSLLEFPAERAAEIRRLVSEGLDARDESALRGRGPEPAWVACHASPVRSPEGGITHAIVTCEDVTQKRAMGELLRLSKETAEKADRAKSDFLASMSHELKSPVSSILAAARLIEMGTAEPEKRAASIIASADGLLGVLGDILDFVRFETGAAALKKFRFPLRGFVARTAEPYRLRAREKGLVFELAPVPDEVVSSDPDRLGRAFAALLSNAVSFTERGAIRVEAAVERREGNVPFLLLAVSDTGAGIPPEDQGRIFQPFVQLASPYTKSGGAGIGLSLARNIVRALGGEIRVGSEPGRGSTFSILAPVGELELGGVGQAAGEAAPAAADAADAAAAAAAVHAVPKPEGGAPAGRTAGEAAASPAADLATARSRTYRILLVDDNEVSLAYMAALLENAGHRVSTATSGAVALGLAEERPPDAAILDIQMPGMSGIELGRRLRAYAGDAYDPRLPLVALTAFDPAEVSRGGVDFAGIFPKPSDLNRILSTVDAAVDAVDDAIRAESPPAALAGPRGSPGPAAQERAEAAVPGLFARLSGAVAAGEQEGARLAARELEVAFGRLGAEGALASLRRLLLALPREDATVVASRLARLAAAWSRRGPAEPPEDLG